MTVSSVDAAAVFVGRQWPAQLQLARARHAILVAEFPDVDCTGVLRSTFALNDINFDLLVQVATWCRENVTDGLTPRQVPVPGVSSKWLNSYQKQVVVLAGKPDLGLVGRPSTFLFAYVDPAHQQRGLRRYDSFTGTDTPDPLYTPDLVIITENKDPMLFFPPVPRTIVVAGGGVDAMAGLPDVPWIAEAPVVAYWGDMDAPGYEILNGIRARGLPVTSILMDMSAYVTYVLFASDSDRGGEPLNVVDRKRLSHLTDGERDVYEQVTNPQDGVVRQIEQERIPLQDAVEAVRVLHHW